MKRRFVIADIHGCCRTFRHLLFKRIKLTKNDTLVLLGDYIDRGPDSKGVLGTIIELQQTGYGIYPILGNHEDLFLQTVFNNAGTTDWLDFGGRATLKSYGVDNAEEISWEHIQFMQKLPNNYVTDTHVFVHAGLNFCLEDPLKETSKNSMLWDRQCRTGYPGKIGGRKLVTGHTVCSLDEIKHSLKKNLTRLDNGCYMGSQYMGRGNLVALELESGELFIQENIE